MRSLSTLFALLLSLFLATSVHAAEAPSADTVTAEAATTDAQKGEEEEPECD